MEGQLLDEVDVKRGLQELNPDIAFDVANNRPGDWNYVLVLADQRYRNAIERSRQPVLWRDKYICSMDRGMLQPTKQWALGDRVVEVPASPEADECFYCKTAPADSTYPALLDKVHRGDPDVVMGGDGLITRYYSFQRIKVRSHVILVGWRHTFENLIAADIPGITRESLAKKFRVDLYTTPRSVDGQDLTKHELIEALRAE